MQQPDTDTDTASLLSNDTASQSHRRTETHEETAKTEEEAEAETHREH